jgi:hypothetical protein
LGGEEGARVEEEEQVLDEEKVWMLLRQAAAQVAYIIYILPVLDICIYTHTHINIYYIRAGCCGQLWTPWGAGGGCGRGGEREREGRGGLGRGGRGLFV